MTPLRDNGFELSGVVSRSLVEEYPRSTLQGETLILQYHEVKGRPIAPDVPIVHQLLMRSPRPYILARVSPGSSKSRLHCTKTGGWENRLCRGNTPISAVRHQKVTAEKLDLTASLG